MEQVQKDYKAGVITEAVAQQKKYDLYNLLAAYCCCQEDTNN
jgi:hypothetical protein